jgi:hypothetical protein
MSDDVREPVLNKFSIAKHFDTTINPFKLIPYRSVESEVNTTIWGAANFLYNSAGELCVLGKDESNTWGVIAYKSGSDLLTDNFAARWAGSEGVVQTALFKEFNGKMYFCQLTSGNYELVSALVASPYTMDEAIGNLEAIPSAQGLVHLKSNTFYIPCGHHIAKVTSAGAFTADSAPSISTNLTITSLTEYGSYLAIGCRDITAETLKLSSGIWFPPLLFWML